MNIGIYGGNVIAEIGPASDSALFFDCMNEYAFKKYPELDWSLLSDRFYKRYIGKDDLEEASALMLKVQAIFEKVDTSVLEEMVKPGIDSELDLLQPNLAAVFGNIIDKFDEVKGSVLNAFKEWETHQPLRILPSHIGALLMEKQRPLEEFDALSENDPPMWMQYI